MTTDLSAMKDREREFHDQRYGTDGGERSETVFYTALADLEKAFLACISTHASGKDVLDYGCGIGDRALQLVASVRPASLRGIDISERAIDIAKRRAQESKCNIDFTVQDCHATSLMSGRFDLVYGNGILHHLDFDAAMREIRRLLKPGGTMVFYEPMGTNPLINLYRLFTPSARSRDEHPLLPSDLTAIETGFSDARFVYFGFFTLVFLPLYRNRRNSKLLRLGAWLDRKVLSLPLLRRLAWSVLIVASTERRGEAPE